MTVIFETLKPSEQYPELVKLVQYLSENVTELPNHSGTRITDFKWSNDVHEGPVSASSPSEETAIAGVTLTEQLVPALEIFISETIPGEDQQYDAEAADLLEHVIQEEVFRTSEGEFFYALLLALFDYRLEVKGEAYLRESDEDVLWFAIEHEGRTIEVKFYIDYEDQL